MKNIKIAIIVSKFNESVSDGLLKGALKKLKEKSIKTKNIKIISCPGAFEIVQIAKTLCEKNKFDAIICLGAVIKGETAHFEYISYSVTSGLTNLNLKYKTPVIFGVLTCYTVEQAISRSSNDNNNKGYEVTTAALDMIKILKFL